MEINKSLTMNATVEVEGGQVVNLYANLGQEGTPSNVSYNVLNGEVYAENKEYVRSEITAFLADVWQTEDTALTESQEK